LSAIACRRFSRASPSCVSITPTAAGAYQATCEFTHVAGFSGTGQSLTISFRLTDGSAAVATETRNEQGASSMELNLSGIFNWPAGVLQTVKLQKKILLATTAPTNNYVMASASGSGEGVIHLDVFRLGGSSAATTSDEAIERSWWAW